MGNHKVRLNTDPSKVVTVDDSELADLTRQGYIVSEADSAKLDEAEAQAKADEVEAARKLVAAADKAAADAAAKDKTEKGGK